MPVYHLQVHSVARVTIAPVVFYGDFSLFWCVFVPYRQEQKPFLLIDFSDFLQTSVYVKCCNESERKNIEIPQLYFDITVFEILAGMSWAVFSFSFASF